MAHSVHPSAIAGQPPPRATPPSGGWLPWVDVSKGMGILLVVCGHAINGLISAHLLPAHGQAATAFYLIYTFHMPLFFFLSGFFVPRRIARDRVSFARALPAAIAYPYLLWSAIQVTVLVLASAYTNIPRLRFAYLTILWSPPSQFWFLYVLGLFHLLAIALAGSERGGLALLALGGGAFVVEGLVPLPTDVISPLAHFLLFYALGVACGRYGAETSAALARHAAILAPAATLLWLAVVVLGARHGVPYHGALMLPAAIAGGVAVMALATRLSGRVRNLFQYLGRRSVAIYVLHVLFVAGARIVLVRLCGVQQGELLLVPITIAGVAGPLAFYTAAVRMGWGTALGLAPASRHAALHG